MVKTRIAKGSASPESTSTKVAKCTKEKMAAEGTSDHDIQEEGTELVNSIDLKQVIESIKAIEDNLKTFQH